MTTVGYAGFGCRRAPALAPRFGRYAGRVSTRDTHLEDPVEGGDPGEALAEAERLAGDDPALLDRVGAALLHAGLLERADTVLERCADRIRRRPNLLTSDQEARVLTLWGVTRTRLGRLDDALRVLYDALELADNGYTALQLGNALRYLGDMEEAEGHLARAFNKAKAERDGDLAIAALCAGGEIDLASGRPRAALERFGEALGITEALAGAGRAAGLTVAPLAGLAQAQLAWDNPAKARDLAGRALAHAHEGRDRVLKARAGLAVGVTARSAAALRRAESEALQAPHRPLQAQILLARALLESGAEVVEAALALATSIGMRHGTGRARRCAGVRAALAAPDGTFGWSATLRWPAGACCLLRA